MDQFERTELLTLPVKSLIDEPERATPEPLPELEALQEGSRERRQGEELCGELLPARSEGTKAPSELRTLPFIKDKTTVWATLALCCWSDRFLGTSISPSSGMAVLGSHPSRWYSDPLTRVS